MPIRTNESAKEEIKRSADVVELIGQVVQLKRAGRNYVGLCPFHAEKEPSFSVNPERQTFYCFGCKKGGDIFTFWMEYHGTTFPEAMKDLAERYHVSIPEIHCTAEEKKKDLLRRELFSINQKARSYFQAVLFDPSKGKSALRYLKSRALDEEIIRKFGIGYAPADWQGLTGFFRKHHVDLEMAERAGLLAKKRGGGYYDRFRDRVVFPILNLKKQVLGFGGRIIAEGNPKYLNTPETPIFHKGDVLYGIHVAHEEIRKSGRAVIVEGYMDCLGLRRHGMEGVVAALGTALGQRSVRRLKGYATEAVLVFDADEAGVGAALKSLPVFLDEGLSSRALILPEGHDPDSFVNEEGLGRFLELLDGAPPMFDFFLEESMARQGSDVEARVRALEEILPVLASLDNHAQQALYVRRLSERLGIGEDAVLAEMRKSGKGYSPARKDPGGRGKKDDVGKRRPPIRDLQLLHLLVYRPDTVSRLMNCGCEVLITDPVVAEIVEAMFQIYQKDGNVSIDQLQQEGELSDEASRRLIEVLHQPFVLYSDEEVEQAVEEFEKCTKKEKMAPSFESARGNLEALNKLLQLKIEEV